MKEITDQKQIERCIEESGFLMHFSERPQELHLYQYEKGELITAPFRPMRQLLFIARGETRIYGIQEDGRKYSVSSGEKRTLLGDVEFSGVKKSAYYVEAVGTVLGISVPFTENQEKLKTDATFLNYVIEQLALKLELSARMELSVQTLEEKLLLYMREEIEDHILRGVNTTVEKLHCSRRQLQRILKKLCEEGKIEKMKKGHYRLMGNK